MEITPEVDAVIRKLAQEGARAQQAEELSSIHRDRHAAMADEDPYRRQALDEVYAQLEEGIGKSAYVLQVTEAKVSELRNRVATMPAPPLPEPLRLVTWHEMRNNHSGGYIPYAERVRRMLDLTDDANTQRARYHQHRVNDVIRHAYATALGISPNLLCFTEFQATAAIGAQRTARPARESLTSEQNSALQEARVIAQGAAVYLRRLGRLSSTERSLVAASLPEFVGVSMERASLAAAAIGSDVPPAGMIHALYGALSTSADKLLNENARSWEAARIHLTHASHIFAAFGARNSGESFDQPLETLVAKMRDDIDAGLDIGLIEPLIYALADALTNY